MSEPGHALSFAWDALGRLTGQTGPLGTYGFQYDLAGRRTRITWPDAYYAQYDWSLYDQVTAVRENGASSGAGVLAQYAWDNLGRRTGTVHGNGVTSTYGYDAISRLTGLSHDLAGTAQDVSFTLAYNPAGQVTSRTMSNSLYAHAPANQSTAYVIDGRNEIVSAGGTAFTYDSNRNLTGDGSGTYAYDAANRMTSGLGTSITYDPAGSLDTFGTRRLASVGGERLAVHTTSTGAVYRRFVPGAAFDETAGYVYDTGTRLNLLTDPLGSPIIYANASGAAGIINRYDEYSRPASTNNGYLQYTGQFAPWASAGVYSNRNRFYNAHIGRFMQTDPISYGDGLNMWAYVGNDPVNRIDPWGLQAEGGQRCINEVLYTIDRKTGKVLSRKVLGTKCIPVAGNSGGFSLVGGSGGRRIPGRQYRVSRLQRSMCPSVDQYHRNQSVIRALDQAFDRADETGKEQGFWASQDNSGRTYINVVPPEHTFRNSINPVNRPNRSYINQIFFHLHLTMAGPSAGDNMRARLHALGTVLPDGTVFYQCPN